MDLDKLIRTIPDYPKPGIMFKDITTLIKDPVGLKYVTDAFFDRYQSYGLDCIAGIESRGFIFGTALAYRLGVGFVPVRKKGKLPAEVIAVDYELEYGVDTIEIHKDAVEKGAKVLIIDDLLATGGTAVGACQLFEKVEAEVVEVAVLIELLGLNGKKKLDDLNVSLFSQLQYD